MKDTRTKTEVVVVGKSCSDSLDESHLRWNGDCNVVGNCSRCFLVDHGHDDEGSNERKTKKKVM